MIGDKVDDTRTAPPTEDNEGVLCHDYGYKDTNKFDDISSSPEEDPFRVRLSYTGLECLKMVIFGITIVPVRLLVATISLTMAWFVSCIGLINLDHSKPVDGWRKPLQRASCFFGRVCCRCVGLSVTIKGHQVHSSIAPVLVVAPHSTFFDALVVFWCGLPFMVNREENKNLLLIGKCVQFAQAIFVRREEKESRDQCKVEIKRRVHPDCEDQWDQFLIFPEGTTSNRKALMTFKPGGFLPGQPIQPVLVRYNLPPSKDTVTWSWDQPHGFIGCFMYTICTWKTKVELEFVSPYLPNEEEQVDPVLFANNVRQLMADKLEVPLCDLTFEDIKKKYKDKSKSA